MTLLAAGLPPTAFAVDGVDISVGALNKARLACYGSGAFRGHIGADVARYFQETPQGRKVSDQVQRKVSFHHDNLVKPDSLAGQGPYAIIFCRNLLIYLTPEARRQVFERLDSLLLPGGLLFTGHTETIFWHQQGYLPRKWDRAFALSKPASQPLQKTAETANTKKLLPSLDNKRQEVKTPMAIGSASGNKPRDGKTFAVSLPLSKGMEKQQQVLPVIVDTGLAEPMMDEQIQEARLLADRGDMDGAVRLCQEYTRKVGPSAETYCLMGVIQMARHDVNSALDYFLKAIYLDPGHYESLIHISLIYREKGDKQKEALYRERAERKAGTEAKTDEKRA
jgi:chemotaxis protein methyltransferase WspC